MKYPFANTVGIIFLTAFSVGVTELALAGYHQTALAPVVHPAATQTPTPSSTPIATPTPTPTATPTPILSYPKAVTNGFVHLRAQPTTTSAILVDLQAGSVVELTASAQGSWQPVFYQGTSGYIYTSYLNY